LTLPVQYRFMLDPQPAVGVAAHDRALTAECPMWSVREGALYWLDGRRDAIYRLEPRSGARASWATPSKVNALGLRSDGLIVAMKSGIALLDTAAGLFSPVVDPEPERPNTRMNDGKVDRAGRFWFSTMHDEAAEPVGRLYRLSPDYALAQIDDGFTIPNGFAWSPDNRTMYVSETKLCTIYAYAFDLDSGEARDRRTFVERTAKGAPDGATTDAQGYVWSACVGGFALARYAPDGSVDRILELPVQRPTSVIFGDDDLRTLYVTTAARGLSPEQLEAQPLAGAILSLRVDVPGLPEPEFSGR
jgi:L-arabinonolactonase